MRRFLKILFAVLFISVIGCGFIGYIAQGMKWTDSLYTTIRMYLFDADTMNNHYLVEIARWIAPILAVSGLIMILKNFCRRTKDFFVSFLPDAVAIYGDAKYKEAVAENIKHAISYDEDDVLDVKKHIIMFSTDEKSLEFYEKNKNKFRGEVFIKLDKNDSYEVELEGVKFFNPLEIIARLFWKPLCGKSVICKNETTIAVVGSGVLSRKILECGLLNNIYSLTQKFEYHLWSDDSFFKNIHSDFNTMNADTVIYQDNSCDDRLFKIAKADVIIITEKTDNEFMSEIAKTAKGKIYYYDPEGTFINIFDGEIIPFGNMKDVLTEENIKTDALYERAKKLNHAYALRYLKAGDGKPTQESAWEGLNTFTKASNIASADYLEVMTHFMNNTGKKAVDMECGEMEHIRWCRFHFMHHWKYGETKDGKKDAKNKIHPCLVPYSRLDEENKMKDIDGIKILLSVEKN